MRKRITVILMATTLLLFTINSVAFGTTLDTNADANLSASTTVTTDEKVDITIDNQGTAATPVDNLFGFKDDHRDTTYTYIYNAPVTITVNNCYATYFSLIDKNTWDKFIFNNTVTINIKNSAIKTIAGAQNADPSYLGYGTEEWNYVELNGKLTINADNVKFNTLIGGVMKGDPMEWPPIPTQCFNTLINGGIEINLKDITEGSRNVVLGNFLMGYKYENIELAYKVKGKSSVNLTNSQVNSVVAARYRIDGLSGKTLEEVQEFAKIDGDVDINLDKTSTVKNYLSGFPVTSSPSPSAPPSVSSRNGSTYPANLKAEGTLNVENLGNFTKMTIANKVTVKDKWQLGKDEFVAVAFCDPTKWKNGDDILTLEKNSDSVTKTWLKKDWGTTPTNDIDIKTADTAKTLFIEAPIMSYTLNFNANGGSAVAPITKAPGSLIPLEQITTKNGYDFQGWYSDAMLTKKLTDIDLNNNATVYAKWAKIDDGKVSWDMDNHNAYIIGYPDGKVKPQQDINRAEVAMILYTLMTEDSHKLFTTTSSNLKDLNKTLWYNTAAATLEKAGIITGYLDKYFYGERSITRAEFATLFVRCYGDKVTPSNQEKYSDIADSWAKDYINKAADLGLVFGNMDGTFRPDHNITRAEAIAIINRFLKRNFVDANSLIKGMKTWPDNENTSEWYYYDIQEATNSHDFIRGESNNELWTKIRTAK
ncbi:MAG: S-layer homology domain-containing protein [Clostridiales bacterium]